MNDKDTKIEIINGLVTTIYEDFDTTEPVIKDKAVAFLLEIDDKENKKEENKKYETKKEKIIIVYDKNALKLGLIRIGKPLKCFGWRDGTVIGKDSIGSVELPRFLARAIIGNTEFSEEQLMEQLRRQGAINIE